MPSPNEPLADALDELAALLRAARADRFRVRAYERVARTVRALPVAVADLDEAEVRALDGVGTTTARLLAEHVATGRMRLLEELRGAEPAGFGALLRLPLVGVRDARRLAGHGFTAVAAVHAAAARPGGLDDLDPRLADRVRESLRRLPAATETRTPAPAARRDVAALVTALRALPRVHDVVLAGAVRRGDELVGDLDVVLVGDASTHPDDLAASPAVVRVLDAMPDRVRVLDTGGRVVTLWPTPPDAAGTALMRATGPATHLAALRERGPLPERAPDEAAVYAALRLPLVPPELRGTGGEIATAAAGDLPTLVRHGDLQGDLHVHTDFSGDGADSPEEMVRGAAGRGYAYLALTDHAENLTINGMPRELVAVRRHTIAEVQRRHPAVRVLDGAELNIDLAGALDYDPDFLLTFDLCVASVHSDMARERAAQTERILTAIASPAVHVIGHPTGRILGRRPGYAIDLAAIAEAAAETGTALEVNGSPARLDLDSAMARAAIRAGARLSLASDAHSLGELASIANAVAVARRGWAEPTDVLNAADLDALLAFTAAKRARAGA